MLEDGHGTSTLGDFNTALTVWLLTKLSKERVYYGDLQHIDKKKKEIKIIGDGACPPSLAGKLGPAGFAEHGIPTEGEAGGLSVKLICKVGEGVLARLGRINGEFQMVITRATIFEPPKNQVKQRLNECGIPFWPHGFVTAHCDIDAMLDGWTNEYACLGYGIELYPALVDFWPPSLRTGMRPEQHSFAAGSEIADGSGQVCRPDPRTGKKYDEVDGIIRLHLLQSAAGFVLCSNHDVVFHHFQTGLHESALRSFNDAAIDEGHPHGIFESVFVNAIHNETGHWLDQAASLLFQPEKM